MANKSLNDRLAENVDLLQSYIRTSGNDLFTFVFGRVFHQIYVLSIQGIRIYWIITIELFVLTIIPFLMLIAIIIETHEWGSLAFSLSVGIGVFILFFTAAFFLLGEKIRNDHEENMDDDDQEIKISADVQQANENGIGAFATLASILMSILEIFRIRGKQTSWAGVFVRFVMILFFGIASFRGYLASIGVEVPYAVESMANSNQVFAAADEVFRFLIVEPINRTLEIVLGSMWPFLLRLFEGMGVGELVTERVAWGIGKISILSIVPAYVMEHAEAGGWRGLGRIADSKTFLALAVLVALLLVSPLFWKRKVEVKEVGPDKDEYELSDDESAQLELELKNAFRGNGSWNIARETFDAYKARQTELAKLASRERRKREGAN